MRDAAVAVCRVHVLPAGTFRPKNVDAQVLVCDLNVDFFRFGKNRDSSGGGVDTTAAFRDWHALNAMNPAFEFELGENARAGHAGDDFLETTHVRSEEHTSELQSLMRISYAVFCLKKKKKHNTSTQHTQKTQTQTHERREITETT